MTRQNKMKEKMRKEFCKSFVKLQNMTKYPRNIKKILGILPEKM